MLLRCEVRGWKNLEDVTVDFPPLLCLAGPNGAGKSNLLEALVLVQKLATGSLREAFAVCRGNVADVRSLLPHGRLELGLTFLVPKEATDEFGARAQATATLLRYELTLERAQNGVQVKAECLHSLSEAEGLTACYGAPVWRESVLTVLEPSRHFIDTRLNPGTVRLFNDPDSSTGHNGFESSGLKRTVLSGCTQATSHPTAFLARQMLASIRFYDFDPGVLRQGDSLDAADFESTMTWRGQYLAAVLTRLNREDPNSLVRVSNLLASAIRSVGSVTLHEDAAQRQVQVALSLRDRNFLASELSDGTLRVLALATLLEDGKGSGATLLLEEPENGVHPGQLSSILDILRGIACDTTLPVDDTNPLRQVVFTSHSPHLVSLLAPAEVRFADGGFGLALRLRSVGSEAASVPMHVVHSFLSGPPSDLHDPSSLGHELGTLIDAVPE